MSTAGLQEVFFRVFTGETQQMLDPMWGFGASCELKVGEETGRLSPPQSIDAFRLSLMVIGPCVLAVCSRLYLGI